MPRTLLPLKAKSEGLFYEDINAIQGKPMPFRHLSVYSEVTESCLFISELSLIIDKFQPEIQASHCLILRNDH